MAKDYDKTLTRLVGILSKLSNDERYTTKEFAQEFGVGVRTIQKDLKERLYSFPIVKDCDGRHMFEYGFTLNKSLLTNDEMMLVSLALSQFEEVQDFDKLTNSALKKLLNPSTFNPYYVKQDDLEDIDIDSTLIETLEAAIQYQNHLEISFQENMIEVEPYKISNFDGIWYLFAKDERDQKTKTFMIRKINSVKILANKHTTTQSQVEQTLQRVHSAWFEDGNCFQVVIKVDKDISYFFKQKKFLQSQNIERELECGSLIISFEVSHDEDVDNMIKSWLPHVEVIEPTRYKNKIVKELEEYLQKIK